MAGFKREDPFVFNDVVSVTPNDSADLPNGNSMGFWVTTAGNLVFDTPGGSTSVTLPVTVTNGPVYIRMKRVRTASTAVVLALY